MALSTSASRWLGRIAALAVALGLLLAGLGFLRGAAPITDARGFSALPPGESDAVELGTLPPRHMDVVVILQSNASGALDLSLESVEAAPTYSTHFASSFRASFDLVKRGRYTLRITDLDGNESLSATVVLTLSGPEWDLVVASGPLLLASLAIAVASRRPRATPETNRPG